MVNKMNNYKINKPCYFYNTGGCYWSDTQCKFMHVLIDKPMEKPQDLKRPCIFYHLKKSCNNIYCNYGHVELSQKKWIRHFPGYQYPGILYSINCYWIKDNYKDNSLENNNLEIIDNDKLKLIIIHMILNHL